MKWLMRSKWLPILSVWLFCIFFLPATVNAETIVTNSGTDRTRNFSYNGGSFIVNAVAQSFTVSTGGSFSSISACVGEGGGASGYIYLSIYSDSSGSPGSSIVSSSGVDVSTITRDDDALIGGYKTFSFASTELTTGTYWAVLTGSTNWGSGFPWVWSCGSTGAGSNFLIRKTDGSWGSAESGYQNGLSFTLSSVGEGGDGGGATTTPDTSVSSMGNMFLVFVMGMTSFLVPLVLLYMFIFLIAGLFHHDRHI